jgi:hypothetical protein
MLYAQGISFHNLTVYEQFNETDRTCQNYYAMHALPNLFYSHLQCVLAAKILYTLPKILDDVST